MTPDADPTMMRHLLCNFKPDAPRPPTVSYVFYEICLDVYRVPAHILEGSLTSSSRDLGVTRKGSSRESKQWNSELPNLVESHFISSFRWQLSLRVALCPNLPPPPGGERTHFFSTLDVLTDLWGPIVTAPQGLDWHAALIVPPIARLPEVRAFCQRSLGYSLK